jgi:hypothetical protein
VANLLALVALFAYGVALLAGGVCSPTTTWRPSSRTAISTTVMILTIATSPLYIPAGLLICGLAF